MAICKVIPANSASVPSQPKHIQTSSAWTIKTLKEKMAEALSCDTQATSRIWELDSATCETGISLTVMPESLKHAWLEPAGDDEVVRFASFGDEATLALECANPDGSWVYKNNSTETPPEPVQPKKKSIFGGTSFIDHIAAKAQPKRAALTTMNMNNQDEQPVASTSSLGAPPMRMTRSQTGSSGSRKGLVGLQNLGNTCFVCST